MMDLATTAPLLGSAKIPEAKATMPPTPEEGIDEALGVLSAHKQSWLEMSLRERIGLLRGLLASTEAVSQSWVDAALVAKGITPGTPHEGEEWLAGPSVTLRNIQLLLRSLEDIERHGVPQLPQRARTRAGGQVVAQVFPTDRWDKLLFDGFTAEIWMQPGVALQDLPHHQARFYRDPPEEGKVALVLGAGNVSSIGPMDALYKLFVEGQVVILKMNPVNEYLGPFMEQAFAGLRDRGFFRVVYGGATEGAYLCEHELVDEIHITGSDKTHDAIVYGVGDEGRDRKVNDTPRNTKRITSELGNVSPMIVVPGPWSQGDLDFQGENLASSLANNAGFNCNATRVVVTHEGWSQREALLDSMRRAFASALPRLPYYPGAQARFEAFVERHPDAAKFGPAGASEVPWTLISGLDPHIKEEICFTTEAFCAVTSEVPLAADSVVEYIDAAVEFANETLWGTLNAAIVVHPKSLEVPEIAAAVDRAIAELRFGCVAVNHWPGLAYGFVSPTWGAYPGHTAADIQSGVGDVHNTYLFDEPQKSVIRGPFRVKPKPAWFISHKTVHELAKKLTYFNARPSLGKIPSLLWSALRG